MFGVVINVDDAVRRAGVIRILLAGTHRVRLIQSCCSAAQAASIAAPNATGKTNALCKDRVKDMSFTIGLLANLANCSKNSAHCPEGVWKRV